MRELIRQCKIEADGSGGVELKYYLLSQDSDSLFSCEAMDGMLYGVSVSAREPNAHEYREMSDSGLTYIKSEALDFINEIADALVTPESFLSVVDEYVGSF